jgi:hypothetical protein
MEPSLSTDEYHNTNAQDTGSSELTQAQADISQGATVPADPDSGLVRMGTISGQSGESQRQRTGRALANVRSTPLFQYVLSSLLPFGRENGSPGRPLQ